ncbi:isochorismatase family protein [Pusillimonas sp. TS35]|uniref:isochorismatase family protein n=1 Tax=Paracandidimonas lactea TaxID=2895524 RepID=UPI00137138F7|nr:isochorismatase family protein [Paracandidimonas lactea]MYN14573.1 isochorismatase family protein [Pusillimonas sp. TS35]
MGILNAHDSMVLMVDMQSALLAAIHDADALVARAERLLKAAQLVGVPVIATEHCADKIGHTHPLLRAQADHVIHKTHFDATREHHFLPEIPTGRHHVLLIGTEAHVCVLQTGLGLARLGLKPYLVTDCIGSRQPSCHAAACERWADNGLERVCAEMVMFEWLVTPSHPQFRDMLALVKAG